MRVYCELSFTEFLMFLMPSTPNSLISAILLYTWPQKHNPVLFMSPLCCKYTPSSLALPVSVPRSDRLITTPKNFAHSFLSRSKLTISSWMTGITLTLLSIFIFTKWLALGPYQNLIASLASFNILISSTTCRTDRTPKAFISAWVSSSAATSADRA